MCLLWACLLRVSRSTSCFSPVSCSSWAAAARRCNRWVLGVLAAAVAAGTAPGSSVRAAPGPRRITTDGRRKQDLAWSPDGRLLACSLYHTAGQIGVALFDPAGRLVRLLSTDPVEMAPAWSPDGKRLAFVHVTHSGTDGELDIHEMDLEGKTRRPVIEERKAFDMYPSWSPDGRQLLFTTTRDRTQEIYVSRADGTAPRRLTSDPSLKQHPCWSPDGKEIAFNSNRDGNFDIYTLDIEGQNLLRLTRERASDTWPAWSPDGRHIAFVSRRDGNPEVYVMNRDGAGARNLSRAPGFDDCPAWMPDGRTLTWVSDRDGGWDVYVLQP